jgi:hypothetical protein
VFLLGGSAIGQTITVNFSDTHQTIEGFGVGNPFGVALTTSQAGFFFGQGIGQLGSSILRIGIATDTSGTCLGARVSALRGRPLLTPVVYVPRKKPMATVSQSPEPLGQFPVA